MTIIPTGFGQVTFQYLSTATPTGAAITFGFENIGSQTAAQCATDMVNSFTTSTLMSNFSSACATSNVRVKLGPDEDGPFADQPMSIGGGGAATCVSPNTALLVEKLTDLGGRQGRGRVFMPGLLESDVASDGTILAASITNLNVDLASFLNLCAVANVPLMLLHGDTSPPNLITALTCDPKAATQRRRMRR